jgi:hypothetical protein
MISFLKDSKDYKKKLLHVINTYEKAAEYKLTFKIQSVLYTNNEDAKKEIGKKITFTIASKN